MKDRPSAGEVAGTVAPVADEPTHSPDGVDLTLIRWMLSLTPVRRLEALRATVRSILRLRRGILS